MCHFRCSNDFEIRVMVLKYLTYIVLLLCLVKQISAKSFDKPVDIVYLWVDGSDPEWQCIKAKYNNGPKKKPDADSNNRYSDHNELKYSLRSVWKYASFVNHIYIVTMNQRPVWLADHPKITIIDHKDIFKNKENLPCFNSMAIECHLHFIPNLKEHFIYFNDDMFLGASVQASDFFTIAGKPKVLFEMKLSPQGPIKENDITYWAACKNTNNLLNQMFREETRHLISHAPYALRKSYMNKTSRQFSEIFDLIPKHKFRCCEDYVITNGLLQYHWNYLGKVSKGNLKNLIVYLFDDDKIEATLQNFNYLEIYQPHAFCLQDKITNPGEKTNELLKNFFEDWYPEPAPWEKYSTNFKN